MPDIQAFAGLRYDLGHVGNLSDVIAPPYDVIDADLQTQLYKRHPANVVRLILNRDEPGDDEQHNRYRGAGLGFLKNWRQEGVLQQEPQPAIYVYHQVFDHEGEAVTRRGFMARCRLERFGEGSIYPHEQTMSGPKQDRLLLTRGACLRDLSQIFGLYPDPTSQVQQLLDMAVAAQTPLEAIDHLGVVHRLWVVTDLAVINQVAAAIAPQPVFVADGHHRYETACNYRDELIAQQGPLPAHHPANFVLMQFVGMHDPGLVVLPTHRLFRGLPELTSGERITRLGDAFSTRIAGEGADLAPTIWEEIETSGDQGTIGLFTAKDERWIVASLTEAGRRRMADVAGEHSPPWQALGVAILHRLVIDTLLAARDLPKPEYVHDVPEVVAHLEAGGFPIAALVMPATVEDIRVLSLAGERMPAKSTYFYPKLLSGLVINPLE